MPPEVITVFRSRLRPGVEEEYGTLAAEMTALAKGMPGFVSSKTFTHTDGERVTVVTFADIESHNAWREHPAHRAAQDLGRTRFYSEYSIQVGVSSHSQSFKRDE
jgi:heme-degrading monooxygenase HmoA